MAGDAVTGTAWPIPDAKLAAALEGLRQETVALDDPLAWPTASLEHLADAGVLGWTIPADCRGTDVSSGELVAGYLLLARACLLTAFVLTQRNAACQRLAASQNESLKAELLPALTAADAFTTVGISHLTTSRQHLARPAVEVVPVEGGFRLNGTVPWVTGADHADWMLTGGTCPDNTQVLLAMPMSSAGITVLAPERLLALEASQTVSVVLEDVEVAADRLVAGPVPGVMQSGGRGGTGSLATSALATGAAAASLDRLGVEASRRAELEEVHGPLMAELEGIVADLLAAGGEQADSDDPALSNAAIRRRANSLVLRASQAELAAAKGAGFTAGHPASRAIREAMFFLVWSCPQDVLAAQLRELACVVE